MVALPPKKFLSDEEMAKLESKGIAKTAPKTFISDAEMARLETKPIVVSALPPKKQALNIPKTVSEFASGVGAGILSTARESSGLIGKGNSYLPKQVKNLVSPSFAAAAKVAPVISGLEESVGAPTGSLTKYPETSAGKTGYITEKVAEFVNPSALGVTASAIKKPLTMVAEKLYQSALKPRNITKAGKVITSAEDIAKIGLNERVWLTKGGVERVANKIDDFEAKLGDAIEEAKGLGKKIQTRGMQSYLDEAKKFFQNQVDVKEAANSIKEIDDLGKNFILKYGKEIPIEDAQKIKVATGQLLKKYYDRLS